MASSWPRFSATTLITGLKCAPLTGPSVLINAARTATVAAVFAINATAALPAARRSPMTPDPTTQAVSNRAPSASAKTFWFTQAT